MRRLTEISLAIALLAACSRPSSTEQFIKLGETVDSVFVFDLFMPDSLVSYDISFYTRVDAPFYGRKKTSDVKLCVEWVSSADSVALRDTVWMQYDVMKGSCAKYRSGVCVGQGWKLKVKPSACSVGFGGIGLICSENGAR